MIGKQKVLIVGDGVNTVELIPLHLIKEYYEVSIVYDGKEMLQVFPEFKPNIVLLDLTLPDISGYQVCQELRAASQVPIIILSVKDEISDKVLGLELSTSDHMIKPFGFKELVAGIKTVLRHYQTAPASAIPKSNRQGDYVEYPDLIINLANYSAIYMGRSVEILSRELKLLYFLVSSPNQVFTKEQLLDYIWGYEYIGDTRIVGIHIERLREKIEDNDS